MPAAPAATGTTEAGPTPASVIDGSPCRLLGHGEVVVEVAGVGVELEERQPHRVRHPLHPDVRAQVGEQPARRRLAALERQPRAAGEQLGPPVGQQEDVGLDVAALVQTETEDAHRDPRVVGRDRRHDRRAVTGALTELERPLGVELGGHEHRAAVGVEVEDLGCVRREQEAVLERPLPDLVTAALEHGDVEGVDLRLQHDLHSAGAAPVLPRRRHSPVAGGATSRASRCNVQSPPRSTDVGTSGSGTIDPTDSPSPVNSNAVT